MKRFLLLASTFLFASCVSIERNNPDDPGSWNYGRSVPTQNVVYGDPVDYEGEIYETVVIGTQTWFQRNLNYAIGDSKCYDNRTPYCTTYGRLYNWATAMGLPDSCNTNSCASQIKANHRGICPESWHIPSTEEWTTLTDFAGGSSTAIKKLKTSSGWNNNSNGQDSYGFSALPGGICYLDGGFTGVGDNGYWWNATESVSDKAYIWYILSNSGLGKLSDNKGFLFSVRCLKN